MAWHYFNLHTHAHTHTHTHTQSSCFVLLLFASQCILCSWTTVSLCVSLIRDGHSSRSLIIDPPSEILSAILISHHITAQQTPSHFTAIWLIWEQLALEKKAQDDGWGRALVKMLRVDRHTCLKSFEPSRFSCHKTPANFDGLITARGGPFRDMVLTRLFYHIRALNRTHLRGKSPSG